MDKELQEKFLPTGRQERSTGKTNPVDEVLKTMLKSQAKSCVRAKIKLDELEKKDE